MGISRFKSVLAVMIFFLINAAMASGLYAEYTLEANALDSNNSIFTTSEDITEQCDSLCSYSIPTLDVPSEYTILNYTISYEATENYEIYFNSTQEKSTDNTSDLIMIKVLAVPEQPPITCNENQCDDDCIVCDDNRCHEPGFECIGKVTIEKLFPNSTNIGVTQINILLRNTGTVDLSNIQIELSGDGISTIDRVPIDRLAVGDKDYAFVKINATKPGNIDLVIKLYMNGLLKDKLVR